jgi:hypothetical protein
MVEEGAVFGAEVGQKLGDRLRSAAGAIWHLAKGGLGRVQRAPPPNLPSGMVNLYNLFARELQDQGGLQGVARGRASEKGTTAFEVGQLQAQAETRVSIATQLQDLSLERVMGLVAMVDAARMEPGEAVRILGDGGEQLHVQAEPGHFRRPDGEEVHYDVELGVGTALPFDEERRRADARELYAVVGEAMLPELLELHRHVLPNPDQILARHQAWRQFQEFVAQMAEEGATAQGGGP